MQKDVNEHISSHPSDKELANFVERRINEARRAEITKHLIICNECSDVVALVMKYGKKKEKPINNVYYKVLGVALVASIVLFMVIPTDNSKLGMLDLSIPPTSQYRGSSEIILRDEIIDADRVLASIINITDLSDIESFIEANKQELKGNFKTAKGLYSKAIIEVTMTSNIEESLKQKIVIHARLLDLSLNDKNQEAIEEYKNILQYEIRLYSTKLK